MSDINNDLKKLFPRRNTQINNHIDANGVENLNIYEPFRHKSYKRSFIKDSKFKNSKLVFSAWTGTRYESTLFDHSEIRNSNMQSCVFFNCDFVLSSIPIKSTTFDNTLFVKTKFVDVVFKSCNFTDSQFINCEFESCKFISCNFDGANFKGCYLNTVVARNLNLDYSMFINCKVKRSEISLFQLFYTIGLTQALENNHENFLEDKNILAFHGKNIDLTDLNEYKKYLITYYTIKGEYFPLANIYGIDNNIAMFKECAIIGIKNAVASKKFRLAVHFSELINYYGYLKSIEKRFISDFMNDMLNEWQKEEDINEYIKFITIIEKNLMCQYINSPAIYVNIKTEKELSDKELSEFLIIADSGFEKIRGKFGEHFISFSHNSPVWFDIVLAVGGSVAGTAIFEGIKSLIKKLSSWIKKRGNKITISSIKAVNTNTEKKYVDLNDRRGQ